MTDSEVENGAPSGATAGTDTTPVATSIPNASAQSSFFPAPEYSLDNGIWDDLELGVCDNWGMPGPTLNWMA